MRTRRGSLLSGTTFGDAILQYKVGDVVKPNLVEDHYFTGIVRAVDTKTNKITVAWGGGPVSQHDVDEIMPGPGDVNYGNETKTAACRRMRAEVDDLLATSGMEPPAQQPAWYLQDGEEIAARVAGRIVSEEKIAVSVMAFNKWVGAMPTNCDLCHQPLKGWFVDGNTSLGGWANMCQKCFQTHGQGLGTGNGQKWDLATGRKLAGSENESLRSRRAMYWCAPDRTYRLTQQEQEAGTAMCPQCKCDMNKERFTRSEKLLICPECGFKVPTSKAVTKVEIKVPAGVEVDVTTKDDAGVEVQGEAVMASRRGRFAAVLSETELADLPRMTLDQIASLVYRDWKPINFGAKPYLEAMSSLRNVGDMYGQDTGSSIVVYFLSNATSWRGDVARAVKKELQRRVRR